ncbi:glycosyltransferase family 2 protein [Niabella sp. W65]|nr:glycosyltransferase family 2 protein [Niabella sp. W65]MCH7367566.1 glycosyltransferase family 2 protein [Niabella sp. W65]ULT43486.1 glycosyltransferase family 2 protein [Niabella sp. I65]
MLLFDIVIPTYNNLEELKKCLGSLETQTFRNFKVWVAVDGSADGTLEYLSSGCFGFMLECLQHADNKNHGRAATRNLALGCLTATYVLFLDSDLVVEHNYLESHYAVLVNNVISQGLICYKRGPIWGSTT